MAVESRFVVIRQGVEVETFMDKKAADEYDKMLDMADNLSEMFEQAPVKLSEDIREELSVYLAQNRDNVLIALQAKKAKAQSNKVASTEKANSNEEHIKNNEVEVANNSESKPKATTRKATVKKSTAKSKTAA